MLEQGLFPNLITLQQVNYLVSRLREVEKLLYKPDQQWQEFLDEYLSAQEQEELRGSWSKQQVDLDNPISVDKALQSLLERLAKLTIIKVVVARELSQKMCKWLHRSLEDNLGTRLVIDKQIDEDLVGGMVIEHEGKQWDYSLRKKLEEEGGEEIINKYLISN